MTRRLVPPALALGILAAAVPSASAAPELIEGSVAPPLGAFGALAAPPVTGGATVFLDNADQRKRGPLRSVGFATVRNGNFRVTTPVTPLLRRAAARNGGAVNLLLFVRTAKGRALLPFYRNLAGDRWQAEASSSPRLVLHPWSKGVTETRAVASQAWDPAVCDYKHLGTYRRYTRVGQLHQWGGFSSTFTYASGSQADSTIGTAVAYGTGRLQASGEITVTNSTVGEKGSIIKPPKRGAFSRYVQTRFEYQDWGLVGKDCNPIKSQKSRWVRATRHIGGSYYKKYDDAARVLDGRCDKVDSAHRMSVAPQSTEYVSAGTARSVGAAVSILGVTLGSQSGWSTNVISEWKNTGTVPRAICSVYGDPNTAPVTYVGGVIDD